MEADVKEFVRRLPDLGPNHAHLIMLAARSRLMREMTGKKGNDCVVERKIIRHRDNWRDTYVNKVLNISILQEHGWYIVSGNRAPTASMGIYATVQPRDVHKSVCELASKLPRWLYHHDMAQLDRIDVEFFAALHSHKASDVPYRLLCVDVDDASLFKEIDDILSPFPVWMITRTGRGYHFVLDIAPGGDGKEWAEAFYLPGKGVWPKIHEKYPKTVELQNRAQEPIPGTLYHRPGAIKPTYVEIVR